MAALSASILAAGAVTECRASAPLVGLCGQSYRATYVTPLETIGAKAQLVSGQELREAATLRRFQALIFVTNADPGQDDATLTAEVERNLADYVQDGGRVLCTFGCPPPRTVLTGAFDNPGPGSDWFVGDNRHPVTQGLRQGQVVRYGAYRYGVSGLGPNARVLLREADGSPAVTIVSHGRGELVQTCGDPGVTAGGDGTTSELLHRLLLYLVYGRAQERFGPTLPPAGSPPAGWPQVHTPRQLALATTRASAIVLQRSLADEPVPPPGDGYRAGRRPGARFWTIGAPPGRQAFAPWVRLPLGDGPVREGLLYRLSVEARLEGAGPGTGAQAHLELRFTDSQGAELAHPHISTAAAPDDAGWQSLSVQDEAPPGATRATAAVSLMLPTGSLCLRGLEVTQVLSPEETFAAEEPLAPAFATHPRVFMAPAAAGNLPDWVSDSRETPFGASRAGLFATIRGRADRHLAEPEIRADGWALPWPPAQMPGGSGGVSWNLLAMAFADRLTSLSLAYAASGDERYGRRAAELLTALAQWSQWYDPVNGRPELDVGYIAFAAAYAYDLIYPALTPEARVLVQAALRRNVLVPLYSVLSTDMDDTNGYAVWTAALGLCAIATLGEVEGAATCVRLAEDRLLWYWDERATNHRSEGQGYDSWAYGLQLTLADALQRNFGAGHLDHPLLRTMAPFASYFLAGDRGLIAWFADSGGSAQNVPWDLPLTILAARTGDGLAGWYLRETQSLPFPDYDFVKLLYLDPDLSVTEPDPDTPGAVFPRVGWAALRSGWEPGGTLIALQCSSANQGHLHQDQNNLLIYRGAENLAMDSGYASALQGTVREFARGAVGHNTVLVDGKGQIANRGRIPYFLTSRSVDYAMGDASAAYSAALLRRFHRHLVYLKPDLLLIVDDLRAGEQPVAFQWLLHPHSWGPEASVTRAGEPLVVGAPAASGAVEVARGGETMRLRFLNTPGLGARYVTYPGAESYRPYLQVDTAPSEAVVLVTLCEFGQTTAEDVALEVADGQVDLACQVSGMPCRVQLHLVGKETQSPRLKVIQSGRVVLDREDLAVPPGTPG